MELLTDGICSWSSIGYEIGDFKCDTSFVCFKCVEQHEAILERVQQRLDDDPGKIPLRSRTVEHPFGTIKAWMGATHFKMKTLRHVATEMALHVLAYNMMRVMTILGVPALMRAMTP